MNRRIIGSLWKLRCELRSLKRARRSHHNRLLQWWFGNHHQNSALHSTQVASTTGTNVDKYCHEIMIFRQKLVLRGTIALVNMADSLMVNIERVREVEGEIAALKA